MQDIVDGLYQTEQDITKKLEEIAKLNAEIEELREVQYLLKDSMR